MTDLHSSVNGRYPSLEPEGALGGGGDLWSVDHLGSIIDRRLRLLVPGTQIPPHRLHQAMNYTLLAPGKRLRPLLAMLTSFHFGRRDLVALDAACAIEMVHAASLVIDDLPAMDNSELRRGQPTVHRQFGHDIAILSGIALLNHAFAVVASAQSIEDAVKTDIIRVLAAAVGSNGLVGGQVMDLREPSEDRAKLEKLNQLKTAALFAASAEVGALAAGVCDDHLIGARRFGTELGLALQILDDLIDDPVFAGRTGKDTGKDERKPTLPSVLGKDMARVILEQHMQSARDCISGIGIANSPLVGFVDAKFAKFPN